MEYSIKTSGLTRTFKNITAVDSLDLSVKTGSLFGFLGPNGAGKSTTIKMLTGLLKPSDGSAEILGMDMYQDSVEVKRRTGVVPEELALFDRLTASEYLAFTGRMYGMEKPVIKRRTAELLELMGLENEGKKLIVDYSHGMKKKLAISAAIIHEPELLYLDEPFEGIDAVASSMIRDILNKMLEKNVTIFLTSHILEIVEKLCSDIAIIHQGKLVTHGSLEELRKGIRFEHEEEGTVKKTLEEIFLSIVGKGGSEKKTLSWLEE